MHEFLKVIAMLLHRSVGWSRRVSAGYIGCIGWVMKQLPDGAWKAYVINSLRAAQWPQGTELRAVKVSLGGLADVRLVPHLQEFDFTAIAYRVLPYEPEVFTWLKDRRYDVVVEIGANVGVFSLFLAASQPQAAIYVFEPAREAYRRLSQNIQLNRCSNLQAFNCAVAPKSGFLDFYEPKDHLTNGSMFKEFAAQFSSEVAHNKAVAIDCGALESLIEKAPRVLIKIDIEGAEPIVLAGMRELLKRRQPDLLIEVLEDTAPRLNNLAFLLDGTYHLYHLTEEGPVRRRQFAPGGCRDYALLPAQASGSIEDPQPAVPHSPKAAAGGVS
jgi:FkbM family methyltransferase